MKCCDCGSEETMVKDSRPGLYGSIRRRRECACCGRRFSTYEVDSVAISEWAARHNSARAFEAIQNKFNAFIKSANAEIAEGMKNEQKA